MLKSSKKIKVLTLLLIVLLFIYFLDKASNKKDINDTPERTDNAEQVKYMDLAPGVSSKKQVVEILGEPVNTPDNSNVFKFQSSADGKPHEVEIENETVVLIKETITSQDDKNVSDILNEHGTTKHILYGPRYFADFHLYVYPDKGIAYVGQPESDILLEIWYFQPTTIEEFNEKHAPDYSTKPPAQTY